MQGQQEAFQGNKQVIVGFCGWRLPALQDAAMYHELHHTYRTNWMRCVPWGKALKAFGLGKPQPMMSDGNGKEVGPRWLM